MSETTKLLKAMVDQGRYKEFMCNDLKLIRNEENSDLVDRCLKEIQGFLKFVSPNEPAMALQSAYENIIEEKYPAAKDMMYSPNCLVGRDFKNLSTKIYGDWDNRETIFTDYLNNLIRIIPDTSAHTMFHELVTERAYKRGSYMCHVLDKNSSYSDFYQRCIQKFCHQLHQRYTGYGRNQEMIEIAGKYGTLQALSSYLHFLVVSRVGMHIHTENIHITEVYQNFAFDVYKDWDNRFATVEAMVEYFHQHYPG